MMAHPSMDLELYAMDALPEEERAAIDAHLADCAACAAEVAGLAAVVDALPAAVPLREPPAPLRARVLASARALSAPAWEPHRRRWIVGGSSMRRRSWLAAAVLGAAVVVLGVADLRAIDAERAAAADRDRYRALAERLGDGGRSWYMAGMDRWTGSGGLVVAPRTSGPPFVVFRDLRALASGEHYTVWLISPDERWVRASNFSPDGAQLQLVELQASTSGFDRCALTVERRNEGSREGAVIMQSRIAPPQ